MDYANWPFSPPDGYKSSGQLMTAGLFLETHRGQEHIRPLYSLGEADVVEEGNTYPSARQIYIHSKGEHDAMRKLVGSFRQWTILKELDWFRSAWELWHAEWLMIQGQDAREWLRLHSAQNVSAASTLFKDSKGMSVGRPKKDRTRKDDSKEHADDADRVVSIRR